MAPYRESSIESVKRTKAESYFLSQLEEQGIDTREVTACGYLKTLVDARGSAAFSQAMGASGYFIATLADEIAVIRTRAPATSKPLLENKGIERIPIAQLSVEASDGAFVLQRGGAAIDRLALKTKNKHFPAQETMLQKLAEIAGNPNLIAEVKRQRRKKWRNAVLLIVVSLGAGIGWAILSG